MHDQVTVLRFLAVAFRLMAIGVQLAAAVVLAT
jgi:hypothetical protein